MASLALVALVASAAHRTGLALQQQMPTSDGKLRAAVQLLKERGHSEYIPIPAPPTDFPEQLQATVNNIQSFVQLSPKYSASILLAGDSTIRTMNNMLLNINKGKSAHVVNDRPADGPEYPLYSMGATLVQPGTQWQEKEYSDHPAVLRAIAATKEMHKQGCTWGGTLETVIAGEPMEGLVVHYWNFLPEYSGNGCWQPCMANAVKILQPRAMMWNIGLHLLNEHFDTETCVTKGRDSHGQPNCGDYEQLVHMGMSQLSAVVPTLVWKTTNAICEHELRETEDLDKWKELSTREGLEAKCKSECTFFNESESCYDSLMAKSTTTNMHRTSVKVVGKLQDKASYSKIHVLDAFKVTERCCDSGCPDTGDGMHYINGTDALIMQDLTTMIAQDERERQRQLHSSI